MEGGAGEQSGGMVVGGWTGSGPQTALHGEKKRAGGGEGNFLSVLGCTGWGGALWRSRGGYCLSFFHFFLVRVSAQREGLEGSLPNSLFFLGNTDTWNSRPTVPPTDDITHVSWWMSRKHPTVLPLEL